ncbi:MAG: YdiU family protein [Desulfurivibrio sp.]|nr:YdiU family protein [Desulfurivibrio sp.]
MKTIKAFAFDNSYARLPAAFYRFCDPTPVAAPRLLKFNTALAKELGLPLEGLDEHMLAQIFAGNRLPEGAQPLAMAYAGHQFGNPVPQLGDGRAILLGEVIDSQGRRRDIQLKGAGKTPFSRGGDGRAPLGPVIREYLVSEAMHALGIPTTRALAAVGSGEQVRREQLLPGALITRVAASHIRVGTFEFIARGGDSATLRTLADYVIQRHYPELAGAEGHARYLALLEAVIERQAELVARWMGIGFIHGVMNTDNTTISGETIDYGPCAFMDNYHPETVFSSIDTGGRYAYHMQPRIAQWNLARFAESLLPLLDDDQERAITRATSALHRFMPRYEQAWLERMGGKIGLSAPRQDDQELLEELFAAMVDNEVDFTLFFRRLCDVVESPTNTDEIRQLFNQPEAWESWAARWRKRLAADPLSPSVRARRMRALNPAVIPRNHRLEQAITRATEDNDLGDFTRLDQALEHPWEDDPERDQWLAPPKPAERVQRTFCGT